MAALTEGELALARAELGTTMNEDDLQERYDRLGDVNAAVSEVLRQRLSDLLLDPASFNTPDYGQSTSENIKALQAQLERVGGTAGTVGGLSTVRIVSPQSSSYSR